MASDVPRRAVVLVDGEHYPSVIRGALAELSAAGTRPVAALFVGGGEKVDDASADLGVPARWAARPSQGYDPAAVAGALAELVDSQRPDVIVDLSDEPVLGARRRLQLASHALLAGVPYEGPDFRLTPPPRPRVAARPTVAVVSTSKRTGKTAVAGDFARRLTAAGRTPVVVAMGRGGPPEPVVIPAGGAPDVEGLLEVARAGGHAASDFYEDALTSGVATVGARRCGGGLAGAVGYSNVADAVRLADDLPGELTLLEGSGAALPPVHADATALVVPGDCDPELLVGYLGRYRLLLADLILVTMCEPPRSSPHQVEAVLEAIQSTSRGSPTLCTVFRPVPLGPVAGAKVFFATTAPAAVGASLVASLESRYGCEVVATSNRLADRPGLRADLEAAPAFEVLLVELKAAAVDVAARIASGGGARVVFCDHRPVVVGPDGRAAEDGEPALDAAVQRIAGLAGDRFGQH